MKSTAFICGVILLFAGTAGAQSNSAGTSSAAPAPSTADATATAANPLSTSSVATFAMNIPAVASPVAGSMPSAASSSELPSAPQNTTGVQGVFESYDWQVNAGYTYFNFREASGLTKNLNGFNAGIVYYPHGGKIGVDGEFLAVFGTQSNQTAKLWAGMGGGRYRWAAPRGIEVWGHGLIGGTKFVPQTAFGGQTALAYAVGGGADINFHGQRLAIRLQGDMVGTRYFNTSQYSPVVSAGFVFKY